MGPGRRAGNREVRALFREVFSAARSSLFETRIPDLNSGLQRSREASPGVSICSARFSCGTTLPMTFLANATREDSHGTSRVPSLEFPLVADTLALLLSRFVCPGYNPLASSCPSDDLMASAYQARPRLGHADFRLLDHLSLLFAAFRCSRSDCCRLVRATSNRGRVEPASRDRRRPAAHADCGTPVGSDGCRGRLSLRRFGDDDGRTPPLPRITVRRGRRSARQP